MTMPSYSRALGCVALAFTLSACSQHGAEAPAVPAITSPAAPKAAAVLAAEVAPDPDAVVQSSAMERTPVFDEAYQGPEQGTEASVTALFARGYIESAMRETMLAAVHRDYPLLGLRDVRLTDPVSRFLTSASAIGTAHDYLRAGVERRLGRALSPAQWEQIWQGLPRQGSVSDWVKQIKLALAKHRASVQG